MKVRGRKFWFKVNAELIVCGATEPDAGVTVADRQIKLRPDGTFSFALACRTGNASCRRWRFRVTVKRLGSAAGIRQVDRISRPG